jgi:drug/metabolite transporter (DMT)-like permease
VTAIIFAILSYFGWGSGDVLGVAATRKIGTFKSTFWIYVGGLLITSLYIPFALHDLAHLTIPILIINVFLGLFLAVCFLAFNEALRIGNSSLVGTIAGSFSGVVVILSLIFFGESLSFVQIISIIVILIGVVFSSLNLKELKNKKVFENRGILLAILVMFGWGIGFTFIKIPIKQIGWFWPSYIIDLSGFIFLLLASIGKLKTLKAIPRNGFLLSIFDGFLQNVGGFSYSFALSMGAAAIVAPIAGAYPTLFVFLSRFVFKDRLTKQQGFGIVVTLVGIVLLAFFSR